MLPSCIRRPVPFFASSPRKIRVVPPIYYVQSRPLPNRLTQSFSSSPPPKYAREDVNPLRKQLKEEAKARRAGARDGGHKPKRAEQEAVDARLADWKLTVGIEIHAQLNTQRKLFSYASTSLNAAPNTHIAPFDLSVPGSLPIFQRATLLPALRAAIALNCSIQLLSRFDRKHYFYHDQPAGYQLTQYHEPFARDGRLKLTTLDGIGPECGGGETEIGIKQIQMEQDTAKSMEQDDEGITILDYNRVGHPLIEIISLPHIHSPETAAAYVKKVQAVLFAVDAVTTGMEMGGLRADVNVSVCRKGGSPGMRQYAGITGLGQRTEIKNLSTIKGVEDAVRAERNRQISILEGGGEVEGETRGWSLASPEATRRLRGKEGEVDYRYMPDPDIPPLRISQEVVDYVKNTLPKLPDQMLEILTDQEQYGLSTTDAKILLSLDNGERLEFYQDVVEALQQRQGGSSTEGKSKAGFGKVAGNWVLHELGSLMTTTETPWSENQVSSEALADMVDHLLRGKITGSTAKQVLKMVFEGDRREVARIIAEDGLAFRPLTDEDYRALATVVMEAHAGVVQQIRDKGERGKLMFLVGQMMRRGEEGRVEAKKADTVLRHLVLNEPM